LLKQDDVLGRPNRSKREPFGSDRDRPYLFGIDRRTDTDSEISDLHSAHPFEELLRTNGRKRSEVRLAVSPYTNPIKTDDLKRYRDGGVEEIALVGSGRATTEPEVVARLEQMAREFVEPAAKL
jgi:hypothetical protein